MPLEQRHILQGRDDMTLVGLKNVSELNRHAGDTGISASTLSLGQRQKLHGEFFRDGQPVRYHPDIELQGHPLQKDEDSKSVSADGDKSQNPRVSQKSRGSEAQVQ